MTKSKVLPRARKNNLVIQKLSDETLVYDLNNHKAHCLNQSVALIWENCNEQTTVQQVTKNLEDNFKLPADEKIVSLALSQLSKAGLLEDKIINLSTTYISRRKMIQFLGSGAAIALPLITSLVIPKAVNAVSCVPTGQPCSSHLECCSEFCVGLPTGTCF